MGGSGLREQVWEGEGMAAGDGSLVFVSFGAFLYFFFVGVGVENPVHMIKWVRVCA